MFTQTCNTLEIELLGNKVILSERTAIDVNNLIEFSRSRPEKDLEIATYEAAVVLRDGLKINLRSLKWWQLMRRLKLKRLLKIKFLIANLSQREIFAFAEKVYELEGVDIKKKTQPAKEAESAGVLATHF